MFVWQSMMKIKEYQPYSYVLMAEYYEEKRVPANSLLLMAEYDEEKRKLAILLSSYCWV